MSHTGEQEEPETQILPLDSSPIPVSILVEVSSPVAISLQEMSSKS